MTELAVLELEAPIVAVTLFRDRALVTRRGTVGLPAGESEVLLCGVKAKPRPDSMRAAGRGAAGFKIIGLETREVPLAEPDQSKYEELEDKLQSLSDTLDGLDQREALIAKRLDIVNALATEAPLRFAKSLSVGGTTLDSVAEFLDFVKYQVTKSQEERAALDLERRELFKSREKAQEEFDELKMADGETEDAYVVFVETASAGNYELDILYTVTGTSWKPLYDARLSLTTPASEEGLLEGQLQLQYLASIQQNTGEDWPEVQMTLSTAGMAADTVPPRLEPKYLNLRTIAQPIHGTTRARRLVGDSSENPSDEIEAEPEIAILREDGASAAYELVRALSVPSDGRPHRGTIAVPEYSVKLMHFAVPARVGTAYLRATLINDDLVLLAGPVNVYRDGALVGTSELPFVPPGQEFSFFLGADESVRLTRDLVQREVDKNFIGNVRRQSRGYRIKLENLKPHRVFLTVLDQIPVSRHENLKVKPRFSDPQPVIEELGSVRWELSLPARSQRELHYEYHVESPREQTIDGLPN